MKPFLISAALAAVFTVAALPLRAENIIPIAIGTNTVAAGASNSFAPIVAINHSKDVAVSFSGKLTGAGTSGIALFFDLSVDQVVWDSGARKMWVAANGTTAVPATTNWSIGAYNYMRAQVHNSNATVLTNIVFKAGTKNEF